MAVGQLIPGLPNSSYQNCPQCLKVAFDLGITTHSFHLRSTLFSCTLFAFSVSSTDKDSNGTIDHEELEKYLRDQQVRVPEKEVDALYHYCDVDGKEGIQFNEFIVLLCMVYLLMDPASSNQNVTIAKLTLIHSLLHMQ